MGTLDNGPFGHLNGRVGNLVSYTLNGKNVVRQVGKQVKPPSQKKLANYQRMTVVNRFLKPMLPFINIGFASAVYGTDRNQYNEAVSLNKLNALQGEYPLVEMDYSKALVSKGDLPLPLAANLTVTPTGVEFTWQVPADLPSCFDNNRAMLLLYFPDGIDDSGIPAAIFELSGARRREGLDFILLDEEERNKPFQGYIAFVGEDRWSVSDSVWCGLCT